MAKTVGEVRINITAGTAQLVQDLQQAHGTVQNFGESLRRAGERGVSEARAVTSAVAVLKGEFANNARAVDQFVEKILGLGGLAQKIFPLVGGGAIIGLWVEMIEKIGDLQERFKDLADAPQRIATGFRAVSGSIQKQNDELRVGNDELENEIAKLEGKPQNNLKLALHEAWLEADKLGDALRKDFDELNKLLKENKVSIFDRLIGGQVGTSDIQDQVKKLSYAVQQAQFEGAEKVRAIPPGPNAAKQAEAVNAETQKTVDAMVENTRTGLPKLRAELAEAQKRQKEAEAPPSVPQMGINLLTQGTVAGVGPNKVNTERIAQLQESIRILEAAKETAPLQAESTKLTVKKKGLQEGADAAGLTRPYDDKIHELDAELRGVQTQLASIGKSGTAETLAKAWAEGQQALAKLNDELAKHHQHLTLNQEVEIQSRIDLIESAKAEEEWKKKFEQTTTTIQERVQSLKLLTAAIGEGYEAQKKATVEAQVSKELGERAKDPEFLRTHQAEVQSLRTKVSQEFDVQQTKTVSETLDKLSKQIELEKSLASAEEISATATRNVTLAYRLREIAETEGLTKTREVIQAEIDRAATEKRSVDLTSLQSRVSNVKESSTTSEQAVLQAKAQKEISDEITSSQTSTARSVEQTIAQLNQEVEATQRLTAAQLGGAEAVRQAELQNRIAQIQREVPADVLNPQTGRPVQQEQIEAVTKVSEVQRQKQIVTESLSKGESYQNRLTEIDQELQYLQSIKGTKNETEATDISINELEKERSKVYAEQVTIVGSAKDGLKAYFGELATSGVSSAQEVHDAFKTAFDSLDSTLAKLVSGQKVSWASFFQSISSELTKMSLRNLEARVAQKWFPQLAGQPGQGHPSAGGAPQSGPPIQALGRIAGTTPPFLPPNLAEAAKLPTGPGQGLASRDGQTAASAYFVSTVDASTASNPAPSTAAAPEGGGRPGLPPEAPPSTGAPSGGERATSGVFSQVMSGANSLLRIFGGFRADGGPVDSGKAHIVGEDGPEFFVPDQDGTIIPNDQVNSFTRWLSTNGGSTQKGAQASSQSIFQGLDALTNANAAADQNAAQQGQNPKAFDNTKSATKIFDVSLPTEPAGNPLQDLIGFAQAAGVAKLPKVLSGGSAPLQNPGSASGFKPPAGAGTPTWDPQSNREIYPDGTVGPVGWTPPLTGGAAVMNAFGGAAGIASTAIGIGLGFLARFLNQKPNHHFKPGQPFELPSFAGYAEGGPVKKDKHLVVGEKGPELFVPTSYETVKRTKLSEALSFGGYRAMGGPVDAGTSYMVGEQGPELWTPPTSGGSIVPNHELGGGNQPQNVYYVDASGAPMVAVEQRIKQANIATGKATGQTSFEAWQEWDKRKPQRVGK